MPGYEGRVGIVLSTRHVQVDPLCQDCTLNLLPKKAMEGFQNQETSQMEVEPQHQICDSWWIKQDKTEKDFIWIAS